MVHLKIEDITNMVNDSMDSFYQDRDRFKGLKALINFSSSDYQYTSKSINGIKPKLKKKQKASIFVKNNNNKKSLF